MARIATITGFLALGLLCAGASAQTGTAPQVGPGVTPGWALMTPEERDDHRRAMQGMRHYDECAAYRDRHHEMMQARVRERDPRRPSAPPRLDACRGLPR